MAATRALRKKIVEIRYVKITGCPSFWRMAFFMGHARCWRFGIYDFLLFRTKNEGVRNYGGCVRATGVGDSPYHLSCQNVFCLTFIIIKAVKIVMSCTKCIVHAMESPFVSIVALHKM